MSALTVAPGRTTPGTHGVRAGGDHTNAPSAAEVHAMPDPEALRSGTQTALGGAIEAATPVHAPRRPGPFLIDPTLLMAAVVVDDLERTRIANHNRVRQLTRATTDSDGQDRGFGLTLDHPDVARLAGIVSALDDLEHQAVLGLQRAMRAHPLGPWVKASKGVGEKQAARLLAAVGDPYWNTLHDRPRTVSELWAYCGLHVVPGQWIPEARTAAAEDADIPAGHTRSVDLDTLAGREQSAAGDDARTRSDDHRSTGVAARRRKGQRANWSSEAKTRAYLVAVSCMKAPGSPYRDVYLARRAHTLVTHPDWTDGHSHTDGLRITAKALLRDLWRAARDLHHATDKEVQA